MARLPLCMVTMLILIYLLSPPSIKCGGNAICSGVAAMRPLEEKGGEHVTYKPKPSVTTQGQGVDGCLPKGLRHSSGPSRYINNQPLSLTGSSCSTTSPYLKLGVLIHAIAR
ncbi:hypothetical protein Tco_1283802 [Tanacetum coccineum]